MLSPWEINKATLQTAEIYTVLHLVNSGWLVDNNFTFTVLQQQHTGSISYVSN